jgi:outer membrane lipoprotein-sorting protein
MRHQTFRLLVCAVIFSAELAQAEGGQAQQGLTAEAIVVRVQAKNAERQAALEHYSSERTYRVEYKGTGGAHWAKMVVRAEYSAPDQRRFSVESESGSKMICEKVLRRLVESEQEAGRRDNKMQMALSPENYNLELVGEENVDGVRAWVLKVWPKVDNKFTYRGRVWVSTEDYAVMRIQGELAKSPSWWINRASFDSRYVRRGEFWLLGRNVSTSHVRIGGDATLMIDYGTYESVAGRPRGAGAEVAEAAGEALSKSGK